MRKASIISLCLHLSVIVVALIGFPNLFRSEISPDQVVHVEAVVLEQEVKQPAPETPKTKPKAKPKAKPKPKPKPKPRAKPKPPPPPPPPPPALAPEPEPVPKKQAERVPKLEPKLKAKPKPKPKPKPKAKPKPKTKTPVRTARRAPKPRRKPKPPPDRFQTLLKNLAKESKESRKQDIKEKKPVKVAKIAPTPRRQVATIDSRRLAAGLSQLVKQQISQCWNIPGGAKDVQNMQIRIRIQLNPDGTLRGALRIADVSRMQGDPFYRAVAESALRALRNPGCSPLKLPYDQYELWKDITLNFDPREALGQ